MRNLVAFAGFAALGVVIISCNSSETTDSFHPGIVPDGGGLTPDGSVDGSTGGNGGAGGTSGSGGQGGASGGAAGMAAAAGSAGVGGSSGQGGAAGSGGGAGTGGAGTGGTGTGGIGTGGTGGTGTGGTGTGGTGGTAGTAGAGGMTPCTTDGDCSGGQTCQILPDAAHAALEMVCAPRVGANGTGITCTDDADCRSGMCLYGYCASPCSSSDDCTQAGTCRTEAVSVDGLNGSFLMCVVLPCANTSECDPGEVCTDVRSVGGAIVAYCRDGQATGTALGGVCTDSAECAALLCPSWIGTCTEVCSSDADCASGTLSCVDMYSNATSVVTGCAVPCSRPADCAPGLTCAFASDTPNDELEFICTPGYGTDPVGADCSVTNNCAAGICLSNYSGSTLVDQICTGPCVTGADCPPGFQVCVDLQMSTPSGTGVEIVSLCNHP